MGLRFRRLWLPWPRKGFPLPPCVFNPPPPPPKRPPPGTLQPLCQPPSPSIATASKREQPWPRHCTPRAPKSISLAG